MNERPMDDGEFARLIARPPGDPERERAERSPRFQAWKKMLAEFESPGESGLTAADRAAYEPELAARVAQAIRAHEGAATPHARRASGGGLLGRLAAWWGAPAARPALAAALAVVVVGGGAWWATHREPAPVTMRGVHAPGAPVIALEAPRRLGGALELRWQPVAEADGYRVVFYGTDLAERARVDAVAGGTLSLRAGTLPEGLSSGEDVLVEIVGLRGGDAFAWSEMRSLRLP